MKNFKGKIAFITGGGSGAGLGQAKVFAKEGMKVAIVDIRQDALHKAVSEIVEYAGCPVSDVLPLCFDLLDREAFTKAADTVEQVFGGPPHLLIQTAGVNSFGPAEASTFEDFDWIVGGCLSHVINGLVIFVPRMLKAYGGRDGVPREEFHVVATSSMGAFNGMAMTAPYCAAKAAVNNLMYSYDEALRPYGGGATVLCPENINSNIGNAEKYRPAKYRNSGYYVTEGTMKHLMNIHKHGIDPVELALILKEGIENGRILVLPYADRSRWADVLKAQHQRIEQYMLTAAEREEIARNMPPFEIPDIIANPPEGAERFGMAKKELDYVLPEKKPQ